jgi:hypothetical protein
MAPGRAMGLWACSWLRWPRPPCCARAGWNARQRTSSNPTADRPGTGWARARSCAGGSSGLVRDAGELLTSTLKLSGPLAGPAEGTGSLATQVRSRRTAGEVDVFTPVHPPGVRPVLVAGEVPGQLPEEPGHDRGLPAVPPQRVEPVAEPAGTRLREIVSVAGELAMDAPGGAVHAQRDVEVIDVELGPLAVAPDLVGGGAVGAVVGALNGMPYLMSGQLGGERVAFPPGVQAAVADVPVVVDGADVIASVAAAVTPGMVDGIDARVGPERITVGRLGVLPDLADVAGQPPDFRPADVGIQVDRARSAPLKRSIPFLALMSCVSSLFAAVGNGYIEAHGRQSQANAAAALRRLQLHSRQADQGSLGIAGESDAFARPSC